jgi:hypothetical protein
MIPDQIVSSVLNSRRTIIVLSKVNTAFSRPNVAGWPIYRLLYSKEAFNKYWRPGRFRFLKCQKQNKKHFIFFYFPS